MDHGDLDQLDVGRCRVRFEHQFVESAPQDLEQGILYVSIRHRSVLHLCACGCGNEVVTPLAPHRWQMTFNGETVSLEPSVGNSSLPCRSHYFITNSKVDWHRPMTDKGIEWARRRDARALEASQPADQGPAADPTRNADSVYHSLRTLTVGMFRNGSNRPTLTANRAPSRWWKCLRSRRRR